MSIGNFDGVHRGHAAIVELQKRLANEVAGPVVAFTFDPHPLRILAPQRAPTPLTWPERKATLLAQLGVDFVVACPTDVDLLGLEPERFFTEILVDRLKAKGVVEGPDFRFGKLRRGDWEMLTSLCHEYGVESAICPPVQHGGEIVSSSRVRDLVSRGDIAAASLLMIAPYRIRGEVVRGAGRGRQIGFPTANLENIDVLCPGLGVYAGAAAVDGDLMQAAIHIGPNPTFGDGARKVEVHILDVELDLYGVEIELEFYERLRDVTAFDSVEALQRQLELDVAATRRAVRRKHNIRIGAEQDQD